jgi:hypothetical protein
MPHRWCRSGFAALLVNGAGLALRPAQLQQVAHGREETRVVPRLGEVVRRAGLHELDRHFQVRPCREQDDRHVRMQRADLAEQRHAFVAAGCLAAEVHVLQYQVHWLTAEQGEALGRRVRREHAHAVHRQHDVECRADGFVVVDDQNGVIR